MLRRLLLGLAIPAAAFDATNWPDFPEYCAKHIETNTIAALPSAARYELNQVQVAIRHGARTLVRRSSCWSGYNATWNCGARNYIEPVLGASTHRSFDVQYTPGETVLRGTCQVGQLLDEGYRQETLNGEFVSNFHAAYIASGRLFRAGEPMDVTNQSSMEIILFSLQCSIMHWVGIYLSSTDMQRTMMSGQLVLDATFPLSAPGDKASAVPWHVGDISQSSLIPNPFSCPRLDDIKAAFESSDGYLLWLHRHDALVETIRTTFGHYDPLNLFDCMLTARCSLSASDMPPSLTPKLYGEIIRFERDKRMKIYTEDDEYAKLSMSKLLRGLRARMTDVAGPRFVLYSGHDDTVMPLLAAIGGSKWLHDWPPYAAFIAFELYTESATGERFVRIIYQGRPLTLPGCNSDDLCPLSLFLKWTNFAETANCARAPAAPLDALPVPPVQEGGSGVVFSGDSAVRVSVDTFIVCVVVAILLGFIFGLLVANAARQSQAGDKKTDKLPLQDEVDDETGGLLPSPPGSPTVAMGGKKK
ncbi:hypothetical protein ACHHYP_12430 [Achlya hypogyna]|uniref:Histidine acid phosphatase n=1 Tax=Achlya hypogyna TaxID=1202772 RepID=A0A1V9YH39_ACHHY|nr:hypothetical protein ACHHYP_12430 [Achlya hypogyna]